MGEKTVMEYGNYLKKELEQAALHYGLEESAGSYISDNYITVLMEDAGKYKAGSVKIDFRKAIRAGLEPGAPVSKPESVFNYIRLVIFSTLFIKNKSAEQQISSLEAYIVYLLHKKRAYNVGVEEERFICDMQEWYKQKDGNPLSRKEIVDAINNLYKLNVADFNNESIYLKETVFGKV